MSLRKIVKSDIAKPFTLPLLAPTFSQVRVKGFSLVIRRKVR